jgi:preprotein translocase subunit SecY
MRVARGLLDRLSDEFLDANMSGSVWRRALVAWISRHSDELLLTIGIFALYRIGIYIPAPGVDSAAMALLDEASRDAGAYYVLNLHTGGNLGRVSIFALGIAPYITASIYVQGAAFIWRLITRNEDRPERPWSIRVTTVVAFLLCAAQASSIAAFLERESSAPGGLQLVYQHGWTFRLLMVLTLTSGASCFIWLSDYITQRGIANGMVLIFVVGIIAGLSRSFDVLWAQPVRVLMMLALAVGVVVLTARGYRRAVKATRDPALLNP